MPMKIPTYGDEKLVLGADLVRALERITKSPISAAGVVEDWLCENGAPALHCKLRINTSITPILRGRQRVSVFDPLPSLEKEKAVEQLLKNASNVEANIWKRPLKTRGKFSIENFKSYNLCESFAENEARAHISYNFSEGKPYLIPERRQLLLGVSFRFKDVQDLFFQEIDRIHLDSVDAFAFIIGKSRNYEWEAVLAKPIACARAGGLSGWVQSELPDEAGRGGPRAFLARVEQAVRKISPDERDELGDSTVRKHANTLLRIDRHARIAQNVRRAVEIARKKDILTVSRRSD